MRTTEAEEPRQAAGKGEGIEASPNTAAQVDAAQVDVKKWEPPSEFDQLKEVNAGAGRLATLAGLLLAATTFTASNPIFQQLLSRAVGGLSGLLAPASSSFQQLASGAMGFATIITFSAATFWIVFGLISILRALEPALPEGDDRTLWESMLRHKRWECRQSMNLFRRATMAHVFTWIQIILYQVSMREVLRTGGG